MSLPDITQLGTLATTCPKCGHVQELAALHARICTDADSIKLLGDRLSWVTSFAVRVHNAKGLPQELQEGLAWNIDRSRELLSKFNH